MRKLPLKSQILLAPAVTIFLIMGLIGFTLAKLNAIKQQNEAVREWVSVCIHTQGAITAGRRLDEIATQLERGEVSTDDDLYFSYLENSRSFADHIDAPELRGKLSPDTVEYLRAQEQRVKYRDELNASAVRNAMEETIPRLEKLQRGFQVQKRVAYTDYYSNVNNITSQLVNVSLLVLAIAVFTGVALSAWTISHTKGRLGNLARHARKICSGNLVSPPSPEQVRDEVDELAQCMSTMTQRLLNVVATEKVLEGAEDERKRIAMDMHDQTLSDLTAVARSIQSLRDDDTLNDAQRKRRLDNIEGELEELANNIRRIIDDLHPQSLDMLGFEKAVRSHMEKRLAGPGMPDYFLHIDPDVDRGLSEFQRLNLYRICLEAIHNAVQHSRCTRYEVDCRRTDDLITLVVEDNGTGMDIARSRASGGHGLTNIEERAKAQGATVTWSSSRFSSGTRFELNMPIAGSETL